MEAKRDTSTLKISTSNMGIKRGSRASASTCLRVMGSKRSLSRTTRRRSRYSRYTASTQTPRNSLSWGLKQRIRSKEMSGLSVSDVPLSHSLRKVQSSSLKRPNHPVEVTIIIWRTWLTSRSPSLWIRYRSRSSRIVKTLTLRSPRKTKPSMNSKENFKSFIWNQLCPPHWKIE